MTLFYFKPTARVGRDNGLAVELHMMLRNSPAVTYSCRLEERRAHELYEAGYRLAYCGFEVSLETTADEYKLTARKKYSRA